MSDLSKELLTRADLIFGKIADAASQAGTFAMEQLPDIATQFITYHRVMSCVFSGAWLLASISLFSLAFWAYKNPWNNSIYSFDKGKKRSEGNEMCIVVGILFGFLSGGIAIGTFNYMVWFAPKIFLITEIVKLVKG